MVKAGKTRRLGRRSSMKGGAYTYTGLAYLGRGADNLVFNLAGFPDRVLRISKGCNDTQGRLHPRTMQEQANERAASQALIQTPTPGFVNVFEEGLCNDTRTGPGGAGFRRQRIQFCDSSLALNASTNTSTTNDHSLNEQIILPGNCEYYYQILQRLSGSNIMVTFCRLFKDSVAGEDENRNITAHINSLLKIFDDIYTGLIAANTNFNGFKHNDLNYRNVDISGNVPTIFDFGASEIGMGNQNDLTVPGGNIDGLNEIVKACIGDGYIEDSGDVSYKVWGKEAWEGKTPAEKKAINENYFRIRSLMRQDPRIRRIIDQYYRVVGPRAGTSKTLVFVRDDVNVTLNSVKTFFSSLRASVGGKRRKTRRNLF